MKTARSRKGMVVAAHPLAARAGLEILAEGGNAVEAAVAVSLAIAVVEPHASGLGGGAVLCIAPAGDPGKTEILDGRGRCPSRAKQEVIYPKGVMLPWAPKTGPLSAAVPGQARLLKLLLQRHGGKMPLSRLARTAIGLAGDGFEVSDTYTFCSGLFESAVRATPECAAIYLNKGRRFQAGERLRQPDHAKTLEIVAEIGLDACTTGEVGRAILKGVNATGPIWGDDDLARYEAKVRAPLWADVRGHRLATMPPPSRGGAGILRALGRYDADPVKLAPVLRRVFLELDPLIGDPDLNDIDVDALIPGGQPTKPDGGTTHMVVVDGKGTIVTLSQTIGHFFGSGVVPAGTGILLNNDLSDMSRQPGHINAIGPDKRAVMNMAPTIVFKDGKPRVALGTPGSLRIFPALTQVIANVLHGGMDLEEAVAAGRIHWEDGRYFFEGDLDDAVRARAKAELDQPVTERRKRDLFFGGVQGVEILDDGTIVGVADPRRDGVALAL